MNAVIIAGAGSFALARSKKFHFIRIYIRDAFFRARSLLPPLFRNEKSNRSVEMKIQKWHFPPTRSYISINLFIYCMLVCVGGWVCAGALFHIRLVSPGLICWIVFIIIIEYVFQLTFFFSGENMNMAERFSSHFIRKLSNRANERRGEVALRTTLYLC